MGLDRFLGFGMEWRFLQICDGDWWTQASSGTSERINDIAWGSDRFVAVGSDGTIVYSSDGITWNTATSNATSNDLRGIAWNGTRFVAVGLNGTIVVSPK